jgi:hypothetical protein
MPVTLNPVGTTLDVTIIDENFETIQDLVRSGVLTTDLVGTFSRFKITRYTGGRIVKAHTYARPFLVENIGIIAKNAVFDLAYRSDTGAYASWFGSANLHHFAMELLGRPGPSFYLTFQEDGLSEPVAAGWPPAGWPISRYPKELCFSRWLSILGATTHVYVDEPCVARVTAGCKGSLTMFQLLDSFHLDPSGADNAGYGWRGYHMGRFGIIVDTNPNLYADEFDNDNPNILDPIAGTQAPRCSWKIILDQTQFLGQRQQLQHSEEVNLKGRRWYNFSYKFREAAHQGWVDEELVAYRDQPWEAGYGDATNSPDFDAAWLAAITANTGLVADTTEAGQTHIANAFGPLWINLWESASINVEFFYGRDEDHITDSSNAEFFSKPT